MLAGIVAAMAAVSAVPAATTCELHVFARDLFVVVPQKSSILIKVAPASDDPLALINTMSPRDRMEQITDDDYRRALQLPADTVVVRHWDVLIDRSVRKVDRPLFANPSPCHFELIGYDAMGMAADRSRIGKNEFSISLSFRQFASENAPTMIVNASGYGAVDTEKKVGREAALESLRKASLSMIDEFGKQVVKQRERAAQKRK